MGYNLFKGANLITTFRSFHDECHSLNMFYFRKLQQIRVVVSKDLELLRSKLRSVDEQVIVLLADRMTVSRAIGTLKKDLRLDVEQPDQWEKASNERLLLAREYHVDPNLVQDIYERIHKESIKEQE